MSTKTFFYYFCYFYKIDNIIDLFVRYSYDLPMSNLKEMITSVAYMLASNPDMCVDKAIEKCYKTIASTRSEHTQSHNEYNANNREMKRPNRFLDYLPRKY